MLAQNSNKMVWTGRIISGLIAAFMIFDGAIHLTTSAPVVEAFHRLGFPIQLGVVLSVIEFVCVALYVCPRTAVLGAILQTGYFGGAVAINLRVGDPLFAETLFPVYFGILLWLGLYLRNPALRALLPFSRKEVRSEQGSELRASQRISVAEV